MKEELTSAFTDALKEAFADKSEEATEETTEEVESEVEEVEDETEEETTEEVEAEEADKSQTVDTHGKSKQLINHNANDASDKSQIKDTYEFLGRNPDGTRKQ